MENVQESEIGDIRPTSDGSDSLQNGQKYDIMRDFRNQLCTVFCTESDFSSEMVREYGGNFLKKLRFFWDPLFVPFLLNLSFEDP